jgi:hypothetical protein
MRAAAHHNRLHTITNVIDANQLGTGDLSGAGRARWGRCDSAARAVLTCCSALTSANNSLVISGVVPAAPAVPAVPPETLALAAADSKSAIAYGKDAIQLLGLGALSVRGADGRQASALSRYINLGSHAQLAQLLERDADLGFTRDSLLLVCTCSHIPRSPAAATASAARARGKDLLRGGRAASTQLAHQHQHAGRSLKQLPKANLNDTALASARRQQACRCCTGEARRAHTRWW